MIINNIILVNGTFSLSYSLLVTKFASDTNEKFLEILGGKKHGEKRGGKNLEAGFKCLSAKHTCQDTHTHTHHSWLHEFKSQIIN